MLPALAAPPPPPGAPDVYPPPHADPPPAPQDAAPQEAPLAAEAAEAEEAPPAAPPHAAPPPPAPADAAPPPADMGWTAKLKQLLESLRTQLAPEAFTQVERLVNAMQTQEVTLSREEFLQQIQAITGGS